MTQIPSPTTEDWKTKFLHFQSPMDHYENTNSRQFCCKDSVGEKMGRENAWEDLDGGAEVREQPLLSPSGLHNLAKRSETNVYIKAKH